MADEAGEYDWRVQIEGRIIAIELQMTNFMIDMYSRVPSGDLVGGLEANKAVMFSSLQNAQRPIGDHEDRVWEATVVALERQWSTALIRAKGFYPEKYS